MFEMFAVICVLNDTQQECTHYWEDPPRVYATMRECDLNARSKIDDTIQQFLDQQVDFVSIEVGCGAQR